MVGKIPGMYVGLVRYGSNFMYYLYEVIEKLNKLAVF